MNSWFTVGNFLALIVELMVAISSIHLVVIRQMVMDYLDLACRKMTQKERSARLKTRLTCKIEEDDDPKNRKVPLGLKVKRLWRFFFTTKVPESAIISDICCE